MGTTSVVGFTKTEPNLLVDHFGQKAYFEPKEPLSKSDNSLIGKFTWSTKRGLTAEDYWHYPHHKPLDDHCD